jgi:regulatory factor X 1/2/3
MHKMLADLNQVDFRKIQAQESWVYQCDDSMVQQLEVNFKKILHEQNSLEQWADWLKGVISQVLKSYEGKPNFAKAATQFLLKWSYYSSLVIRDLSLSGAASFGSIHVVRLLYDEYIFFIIEHKVALETGETAIAVMGKKYNDNQAKLSDLVQPRPCNWGLSLTEEVPVNVGWKMAPTTLVAGTKESSHRAVVTKRLKIG